MQGQKEVSVLLLILSLSVAILGIVSADFVGPSATPPTGNGVITASGGNVGIGTTGPGQSLEVFNAGTYQLRLGYGSGFSFDLGRSGTDGKFRIQGNQAGAGLADILLAPTSGNVGIGTAAPGYKLDVSGDIRSTGTIYADASGAAYLNGGDDATLNDVNVANTVGIYGQQNSALGCVRLGSGGADLCGSSTNFSMTGTLTVSKVNANTIDPIYTIDGERYATYVASMVGIKEEVTGLLNINKETTIDFRAQEKGSDLWLFAKAADLERNFKDMAVILTPSFDGNVWYEKDADNLSLTIHSDGSGEVSYRLTAPRFDWISWPNLLQDGESPGLIINTGLDGKMISIDSESK